MWERRIVLFQCVTSAKMIHCMPSVITACKGPWIILAWSGHNSIERFIHECNMLIFSYFLYHCLKDITLLLWYFVASSASLKSIIKSSCLRYDKSDRLCVWQNISIEIPDKPENTFRFGRSGDDLSTEGNLFKIPSPMCRQRRVLLKVTIIITIKSY